MHEKKFFIFKLKLSLAQWLKAKTLASPVIENTFDQWLKIANFIIKGQDPFLLLQTYLNFYRRERSLEFHDLLLHSISIFLCKSLKLYPHLCAFIFPFLFPINFHQCACLRHKQYLSTFMHHTCAHSFSFSLSTCFSSFLSIFIKAHALSRVNICKQMPNKACENEKNVDANT